MQVCTQVWSLHAGLHDLWQCMAPRELLGEVPLQNKDVFTERVTHIGIFCLLVKQKLNRQVTLSKAKWTSNFSLIFLCYYYLFHHGDPWQNKGITFLLCVLIKSELSWIWGLSLTVVGTKPIFVGVVGWSHLDGWWCREHQDVGTRSVLRSVKLRRLHVQRSTSAKNRAHCDSILKRKTPVSPLVAVEDNRSNEVWRGPEQSWKESDTTAS